MSKSRASLSIVLCLLALGACAKKSSVPHASPDAASVPSPPTTSPAVAPVDPTEEQTERTKKLALLDYATMEDKYINDPRAQWASAAKASSTFGQSTHSSNEVSQASNIVGPVDGNTWTNDSQNIGFDWVQADFAKPVHATEIRVVFSSGQGVEAVNKLEVADADGHWTTVWSGLSDTKIDSRGTRTWFVRTFDKTDSPVKMVKVTIANNVQSGYKVVDAMQLVGD